MKKVLDFPAGLWYNIGMVDICDGSLVAEQGELNLLPGGGSTPTPSLQIRPIVHGVAKDFVEAWHYSGRMPTGKNISYGLYDGASLYAVIVYGIGVNPYQAAYLGVERVVEIKRMCRVEPRGSFPLSRLISITRRWAKKELPYEAIVAFADPEQGHEGTVYKASGFAYCGTTNPEWHLVDSCGNKRHRRYAYRFARRNKIHVAEAREQLGLERVKTAPKHRWVRYE